MATDTASTSDNSTVTLGSQDIQAIVAGLSANPAALASMANYMLSQLPPAAGSVSSVSDAVSSSSASGQPGECLYNIVRPLPQLIVQSGFKGRRPHQFRAFSSYFVLVFPLLCRDESVLHMDTLGVTYWPLYDSYRWA